jgi:hypothetical protein
VDHYLFEFTTSHFPVEPFEEDELNTGGDFGKALTRWLSEQLQQHGVVTEALTEDWGRWLVVHWRPFFLAVRVTGLGHIGASIPDEAGNPVSRDVLDAEGRVLVSRVEDPARVDYAVWIHTKTSLVDRLLRRYDTGRASAELRDVVQAVLRGVPGLSTVHWVRAPKR